MLIYPLNSLFIHIPKTAGQSIEQCFLQFLNIPWEYRHTLLLRPNHDPAKGPPILAHLTAKEYLSYGYISPQEFTKYFKFSFVRNPWERLVSEYNWRGHYNKYTFKYWLKKAFPKPGWTDVWRHVMPQYEYLFDADKTCLVDFIGRFERLEHDFELIRNRINRQLPDLSHVNQSSGKRLPETRSLVMRFKRLLSLRKKKPPVSYLDYYDYQTWAWVAERYQKDIDTFGYTDYIDRFENPCSSRKFTGFSLGFHPTTLR